jgi:hypothetical protein
MDVNNDKIIFSNIIPNMWINYIEGGNISNEEYIIMLKRFIAEKNIVKIIRLDQDTGFWYNKQEYIQEINIQVDDKKRKQLSHYIKDTVTNLEKYNKLNTNVLIISGKNIEIVFVLLAFYFSKITELPINKTIKGVKSKFNINKINLSPNMIRLIQMYDIK